MQFRSSNNKSIGTSTAEFLLMQFSELRELQLLHFFAFMVLYLITVTGNLLIIAAVTLDHHLNTPMYFFLMNLAITDMGSVSVIIPKSMANSLINTQLISYSGCVAQVFFLIFFQASDFAILTVMAHDRYVAICNPLRYETVMNKITCIKMISIAWISGLLHSAIHTGSTFTITFCSNVINQFFCEIPKIRTLSCSDLYLVEGKVLAFSFSIVFLFFIFIIVSYVKIFSTVLKMPSVQGRQKAFSTCLPHLIVISFYIFAAVIAFLRPASSSSSGLDLVLALLYAVVPPMMNPLIYSIRNKAIKHALQKLLALKYFPKVSFF